MGSAGVNRVIGRFFSPPDSDKKEIVLRVKELFDTHRGELAHHKAPLRSGVVHPVLGATTYESATYAVERLDERARLFGWWQNFQSHIPMTPTRRVLSSLDMRRLSWTPWREAEDQSEATKGLRALYPRRRVSTETAPWSCNPRHLARSDAISRQRTVAGALGRVGPRYRALLIRECL
jgi:hypothetical protein